MHISSASGYICVSVDLLDILLGVGDRVVRKPESLHSQNFLMINKSTDTKPEVKTIQRATRRGSASGRTAGGVLRKDSAQRPRCLGPASTALHHCMWPWAVTHVTRLVSAAGHEGRLVAGCAHRGF